jgi:serralysin
VIVDFQIYEDRIDVAKLGYTGFGDGTDHTLKISYSAGLDRTYLKDLVPDAQGHRFEIAIDGEFDYYLNRSNVIFAKAALPAEGNTAPDVPLVVLGVADALRQEVTG